MEKGLLLIAVTLLLCLTPLPSVYADIPQIKYKIRLTTMHYYYVLLFCICVVY